MTQQLISNTVHRRQPILGNEDSALFVIAILALHRGNRRAALQYINEAVERGIIGVRIQVPAAVRSSQHALEWSDERAHTYMRFTVPQLEHLAALLGLPEHVVTASGDRVRRVEALAIVCRRVAEPCRWYSIESEFWRSRSSLSRIFWTTVIHIISRHSGRLKFHTNLLRDRIELYCAAVRRHGAPISGCFAFIDGTKNYIARPAPGTTGGFVIDYQRPFFSGYKRRHCMTWQAISTPDGLCVALCGPAEGVKHDSTVLKESGVIQRMESEQFFAGKVIYGDDGYGVSDFVCAPYHGSSPTVYELALNSLMSSKRLTVEWLFKDLKTLWSHVNWHMKMQARKTKVGLKFSVAMLLSNLHTCMYGSQTARYFNCSPPSVEEYLAN